MWLRKWIVIALILAVAACASAARLVWDANQDEGLTVGYKIYYGIASGQYTNSVDVGNVTEWPIPSEWPRDHDYYFAATAYSADEYESGYSNEAVYYRDTVTGPAQATDVRITFTEQQGPPMATVRTVTVKASGGDYTTLNAAFAGEVGNLVSLDRQLDIVCDAIADTTMANTTSGWTTDATRFVRVKAAAGAENKGIKDQGYRIQASGDRSILCYVQHIRFEDIQITGDPATANSLGIQFVGSSATTQDIRIDRCYLQNVANSGKTINIPAQSSGTNKILIRNSLLFTTHADAYSIEAVSATTNYTTIYIYNSTLVGKFGLGANNTAIATNTIFTNPTVNASVLVYGGDGASLTCKNCAFDDAPSVAASTGLYYQSDGGGNRTNQTFTFVDSANGDYHLDAADAGAKDYGTDLSGDATYPFSVDIDGETRSGTWNIGMDEDAAAGGSIVPLLLNQYRARRQ